MKFSVGEICIHIPSGRTVEIFKIGPVSKIDTGDVTYYSALNGKPIAADYIVWFLEDGKEMVLFTMEQNLKKLPPDEDRSYFKTCDELMQWVKRGCPSRQTA